MIAHALLEILHDGTIVHVKILDAFKWRDTEEVYTLPWLPNKIEFTADPERVKDYKRLPFTRSALTRNILSLYHLSHNSIVTSADDHAMFLRAEFFRHTPPSELYPSMGRDVVRSVLPVPPAGTNTTTELSPRLIRVVYENLLTNLLGIEMTTPIQRYIDEIDFQPGRRPMYLNGLMYAFGGLLPGSTSMARAFDLVLYRRERYTRKVATRLEDLIFAYALPRRGSWYARLLELKADEEITDAHFRGELTSAFVSAYSLAAALTSMILCLAARPHYCALIRADRRLVECFVNEVLRMNPPFRQFGYERIAHPEASDVPDSTDFMIAVNGLHRNPLAWADPATFTPERFLQKSEKAGHQFMPFGIGKRSCTGRIYSMRLMMSVLEHLVTDDCAVDVSLPSDYRGDELGLPVGIPGRLISFPFDDRVTISARSRRAHVGSTETTGCTGG